MHLIFNYIISIEINYILPIFWQEFDIHTLLLNLENNYYSID